MEPHTTSTLPKQEVEVPAGWASQVPQPPWRKHPAVHADKVKTQKQEPEDPDLARETLDAEPRRLPQTKPADVSHERPRLAKREEASREHTPDKSHPEEPAEHPDNPTVYIVGVCDGIGAIYVAARNKGADIQGTTCEAKNNLREFVQRKWPNLKAVAEVKDLQVDDIVQDICATSPDLVLLVGGPPCQPFTELATDPQGWSDPRSEPIVHFKRIRDGMREKLRAIGIDFAWLMEEVASMTKEFRDQISAFLDCQPVLLHAADFGWIHRPRLYWGLPVAELCARPRPMPTIDILAPGTAAKDLCVIRYTGPPIPRQWQPEDGFEWTHRKECGTRAKPIAGTGYSPAYPAGRFLTLTTAFPHPADRPPKVQNDRHVYQRFMDDHRMQPLYTYVRGNMLWKGTESRPLNERESEQLMGFPPDYTEELAPEQGQSARTARRHALGNTFHIPSIMVLLALLICPGGRVAEAAGAMQDWSMGLARGDPEAWARDHATGTMWGNDA